MSHPSETVMFPSGNDSNVIRLDSVRPGDELAIRYNIETGKAVLLVNGRERPQIPVRGEWPHLSVTLLPR